ncbi:MAG: TIGR04086 family membrane protein [Clostridia bacterium]|nr:TIGR04086 family membrane protein [Clostridia bacterium]
MVTSSIKKNGILNGGLIGLIYILLLYLLSSLTTSGFLLNIYSAIMIITGVIAGMVGGVVGVNLK